MATWTAEELDRIGNSEELRLTSSRSDGSLRKFVRMWVVRVGNDLFVRSAYGPNNPWYRRAKASGAGRIKAGGMERSVVFEQGDPDHAETIDAAYHLKYDRYGPRIVGTVVGPQVKDLTIRLVPLVEQG